eukprot:555476-Amorphochlora_amoeboformis.AAC.2
MEKTFIRVEATTLRSISCIFHPTGPQAYALFYIFHPTRPYLSESPLQAFSGPLGAPEAIPAKVLAMLSVG